MAENYIKRKIRLLKIYHTPKKKNKKKTQRRRDVALMTWTSGEVENTCRKFKGGNHVLRLLRKRKIGDIIFSGQNRVE